MKRIHLVCALVCSLLSLSVAAQDTYKWETYYRDVCNLDDVEDENWEEAYEQLCDLDDNKIDLNKATKEDLERLFFLTPAQVEELSEYLYRYAPLRSLGELAMIESLDRERRLLMSCFVYLGDDADKARYPSLREIAKYGKHELVATAKIPLYDRAGDKNGYLGYKYKHWLRYTFKLGQAFQAGVVGAQDAGEPFFAGKNKWGYDYYSYYVMLRGLGRIKSLALGCYKLRFGLGLVMNTNFSFGKTMALSAPSYSNAISPHASRSDGNYLQGAAAMVTLMKGLDLSAFFSYRKRDATLDEDGNATTLLTSGYHRTPTEMEHKHNTAQMVTGGNLRYFNHGFHVGGTFIYTTLSRELQPDTRSLFRKYYPSGKEFWNASIDYGYVSRRLTFDGETATGDCGAIATMHRLIYEPSSTLSLTAIQRFYSYRYYSLFSRGFSDGGRIQNESGVYLGAMWAPTPAFSLTAYSDIVYFAWPRYKVSASSHAWDNFLSATYKHGRITFQGRYRLRLRQYDDKETTQLTGRQEHRGRVSMAYQGAHWKLSTQGDCAYNTEGDSFGWMITECVGWDKGPLSLNVMISYFKTDDYNSRLYTYERGVRYNFSFPMFYGNGIHYAVFLRADICKNVMMIGKVATTDYFDRNSISSSYQRIDHTSMTDVDLQLRWKF